MFIRRAVVVVSLLMLAACGGGSTSDGLEVESPLADAPQQPTPEPTPEPTGVLGDTNGNGISDAFESTDNDRDGDLISDLYDSDLVQGDDSNRNGVTDIFEGGYDPNQDGFNDLFLPAEQRSNVPLPLALGPVEGEVVFIANYESGAENSGNSGIEAFSPPAEDAISVSSSIVREGNYSINHRVRFSDDYISAGRQRAESNTLGLPEALYNEGDKRRYQFSIFLETPWPIDTQDSLEIIWQWKRFGGGPDMFVLIRGTNIELRALAGDRGIRKTIVNNYRVGEWIDLQIDVDFSAGDSGLVKTYYKYASDSGYIAGEEYAGPNMENDMVDHNQTKWGVYMPAFSYSLYPDMVRSVYHDAIRVTKRQ